MPKDADSTVKEEPFDVRRRARVPLSGGASAVALHGTSLTYGHEGEHVEGMKDRIALGFVIAALYNSNIVVFSKGFSSDLGAIDPLFSPIGCVFILLWGAAYLALAKHYRTVPALALVFCVEKAVYAGHWTLWISEHGGTLGSLIEADPLTGLFMAAYGAGDALFMVFFGWVGWRWRHAIRGGVPDARA